MRFIVYRPLSGPWAQVMILSPRDSIPETVGEGILKVIEMNEPFHGHYAEIVARGICEGLMTRWASTVRDKIEWHWSHE